ncbi:hypothetical protein Ddye_024129 [Dipteronia dyeriana]|uniref:Reverse transcriptase domain-containing protein n=1 Tax=Dipteronia dyeriana TaxID=168575 RepID=A0AAD9TUV5_9ROSI|nr:hypothetical protein Ddye_024129 [Dipteronia dyeriana]
MFDMGLNKALGLDGFLVLFYYKYWDTIWLIVTEASLKVLNERESLREINNTLVCLTSKVPVPKRITDFRPISLCNMVYKIVARHRRIEYVTSWVRLYLKCKSLLCLAD